MEERTLNWYMCDNIVHPAHNGQIGLLHMGFPRVFILIRDYGQSFTDFDNFRNHVAEVNFFSPADREDANIEELLTDAWNFLALQEDAEDKMLEDYEIFP